jgi:hypothetical protein
MSGIIFWPYDEITISEGVKRSQIVIDSPWLKTTVELEDSQIERAKILIRKFSENTINGKDLPEVNWLFSSLSAYPLSYFLPRGSWEQGLEVYQVKSNLYLKFEPREFIEKSLFESGNHEELASVSLNKLFEGGWKWDHINSLQFSTTEYGIDPVTLLSVARRFHLLSSVESNGTEELYKYVQSLKNDKEIYKKACGLMVRQNHYVTELCNSSLKPALKNTKSAVQAVQNFLDEEYGHDRILNQAIKTLVDDPLSVKVLDCTKILMDLLSYSAKTNFLAFAMVVDFFERSSYQKIDPLAAVLLDGGHDQAAGQINKHMDINDEGGHENIALDFLKTMGPISEEFAIEALQISEVTTNVMNLISSEAHKFLLNSK